jgi:20S proteasome subunit alpha 2
VLFADVSLLLCLSSIFYYPRFAATNGVVIATEKKVKSPLVDDSTVQCLVSVTEGIGMFSEYCCFAIAAQALVFTGMAYAGMGPDFRLLTRKAQKRAQEYYLTYKVRQSDCLALHVRK